LLKLHVACCCLPLLLQVWGAVKLLNAMGMYGTARQLHYGYLGEHCGQLGDNLSLANSKCLIPQ
jgi:hypothetical protein